MIHVYTTCGTKVLSSGDDTAAWPSSKAKCIIYAAMNQVITHGIKGPTAIHYAILQSSTLK